MWLWRVRLSKTRSLAGALVSSGKIRIEQAGAVRKIAKPSAMVRPGDKLAYATKARLVRLTILSLPDRRGPSSEAVLCYELDKSPDPAGAAGPASPAGAAPPASGAPATRLR